MDSVGKRMRCAAEALGCKSAEIHRRMEAAAIQKRVPSYATVHRYFGEGSGRDDPPVTLALLFAQTFDISPRWLLYGQGKMPGADERADAKTREEELRKHLRFEEEARVREIVDQARSRPDEAFIWSESFTSAGSDGGSGLRREAVLRFATKLFDVRRSQERWMAEEDRHRLLRAAAIFLREVEGAIYDAARESWEEHPGPRLPIYEDSLLVVGSESDGWYVTWSDAVLDLFARRVIGLGERDPANRWDQHEPAGPFMTIRPSTPAEIEAVALRHEESEKLRARNRDEELAKLRARRKRAASRPPRKKR